MERRLTTRSATRSLKKPGAGDDDGGSPRLPEKRRKSMPVKSKSDAAAPVPQGDEVVSSQLVPKEDKVEMKRRRSSFARGRTRKSIGATNTDVTELHTKIPTDKPPEERLRLLKLACFEYTINKLHEEIPLLETLPDFRSQAKSEFINSLQGLVEDGTLNTACYSRSRNENPLNLEMQNQISQLDSKLKELEDERNQWDEMLTSYSQRATEAAKLESIAAPVKEPDALSMPQRKCLAELPDLDAITSWAGSSQNKVALQVQDIMKTSKQVKNFQDSVESFLMHGMGQLAKETSRGFADINNPQSLLTKIVK